jgi:HSP20 family protein
MLTMKKLSFFDRLSGSSYDEEFESDGGMDMVAHHPAPAHAVPLAQDEPEGQLPVDMFDGGNQLIIRAFVAGVRPDEINVSIARDKVEIQGSREERDTVVDQNYMHRELFWGSFVRTIHLPVEVDVDGATAQSKDGLMTITLPKLDKARQTKLRVRAN